MGAEHGVAADAVASQTQQFDAPAAAKPLAHSQFDNRRGFARARRTDQSRHLEPFSRPPQPIVDRQEHCQPAGGRLPDLVRLLLALGLGSRSRPADNLGG